MQRKDANTNQRKIAKFILQKKETSKQEIASALELSMPTVLQNVKELVGKGLVTESGKYDSTGGRKAAVLSVAKNFRTAVGIDITANHVSYVLTDLCGDVIAKTRIRAPFENSPAYFDEVADRLGSFLQDSGAAQERVLGVGISLPGIIDESGDVLVRSHVLKQDHLSLKPLRQRIPYPVSCENDATGALLAEMHHIDGDLVYLSLSNSVGGAICLNGKIYEGGHRRSAEFGHMILEEDGKPCYCGKKGCADAYCSAAVLLRYANSLDEFFERLQRGEARLKEVWEEYLEHLAVLITNLRMAFDCDIMLGGYVGGYLKAYLPQLSKKAVRYNLFESDTLYLRPCTYEKEASAIGAAMCFFDRFLNDL